MKRGSIIGIDIGGTKVSGCLARRQKIVARVREATRLAGGASALPGQVHMLSVRLLETAGTDKDELAGVGISAAGPFRRKDGMIELVSPNLCGALPGNRGRLPNDWTEIPLEKELRKSFDILRIGNDAVCGAVAERAFGAGRDADDLVYVTWSTGIGTGAFVDGKLISGRNGNAPHGGHIYVAEEGHMCGCGNRGDLESLVSGPAIARDYGGGITTTEVFERYRGGDGRAAEIIQRAARNFARGLASVNAVLDTSMIIIGGSVFLNNIDLLLPMVREEFYRSFSCLSSGVEIVPSELKEDLGDLGGLALVMPSKWVEEWRRERPWER